MADKVIWNEDKNRPFINPYNFVSTTQRVKVNPVEKGNLTGYVTCTLRVEDRLALPDIAQNPDSQSFDFFSVENHPIIPGSELRGCIRSAYEAITESCFSVVNSNLLSKRMSKPNNQRTPGILMKENGRWVIYSAKYRQGKKKLKEWEKGVHCDCARKWFKLDEKPTINNTYFFINKNRKNENISSGAICEDDDIDKLIQVFDTYFEGIKKTDTDDAEQLRNIIRNYQEDLRRMKKAENSDIMVPVFYEKDDVNLLVYLSPAQTGRVAFENTVPSLLGNHTPCDGRNGYCPACSLFGTLGDKNPLASKLRFTDASEKESSSVTISDRYVILPELSSPKLSSPEFYSTCRDKTENVTVWDYDSADVVLRGRKFYYHGLPKEADVLGSRQIETKVAKSGSLFTFKLYFDRINEEQLQQLLWVLTIGENQTYSKQMHKIGMGKPVGYGSVKITVDDISFRELDKSSFAYSIKKQQYDDYMQEFDIEKHFDMGAVIDFKTITNYSFTVCEDEDGQKREIIPISYPIAEREPKDNNESTENLSAGHQWFTGNRKPNSTFGRILPILSSDINAMRLYALHGKNEITPTKNKERTSKNNKGKYKPRVFFEKEIPYAAEIVGIHEENGEKMVDVTVCGEKAKIKLRFLPKRLQNDVQKAIEEHSTISVTFQFMSKTKEPVFFVVPGQT